MSEITNEQLGQLGRKLDELGEQFTSEDRAVLLTTFGLAAQALGNAQTPADAGEAASPEGAKVARAAGTANVARVAPSIVESDIPLSEGLRSAFEPGQASRFVAASDGDGVHVEVGVGIG